MPLRPPFPPGMETARFTLSWARAATDFTAIWKYVGSRSKPILSYPTELAAARVEPEPANGSRITPSPRGKTALTTHRKKSWGFNDGCGAISFSAREVGFERIT